jgi:hypothetical protein
MRDVSWVADKKSATEDSNGESDTGYSVCIGRFVLIVSPALDFSLRTWTLPATGMNLLHLFLNRPQSFVIGIIEHW